MSMLRGAGAAALRALAANSAFREEVEGDHSATVGNLKKKHRDLDEFWLLTEFDLLQQGRCLEKLGSHSGKEVLDMVVVPGKEKVKV